MGDRPHPDRPHPDPAPGPPLWLCLWVQVRAVCGQRQVGTELQGRKDGTAWHTTVPSLPLISWLQFSLYTWAQE